MNERIRELIQQSHEQKPVIVLDPETCQPTHKIGNGGVPMYHSELNPEKFAELLIRECAGIDFRHKVGMTTDQEFDTGRVILEHFGVEE